MRTELAHPVHPVAESQPAGRETSDFSIVEGGALYQLLLPAGLVRPSLGLLARRTLVLTLIAWLPLLLLAVMAGRAWGGVRIPFLYDIDAHVRFLVSLPLLLYAETLVHQRMRPVVAQFIERNIVRPEQRERFESIIASSMRLRNSPVIELLMAALVLTVGHVLWRRQIALHDATWYANVSAGRLSLTLPGVYFAFVSVPIFQFILLRWYFRLVIWCQLLWRVSRLDLKLIPTHPDRMAGLGFLQGSAFALLPLLLAQSGAGGRADRRSHFLRRGAAPDVQDGRPGPRGDFADHGAGAATGVYAPAGGVPAGGDARVRPLCQPLCGGVRAEVARARRPPDEALLGSADVQSLADLGNSLEVVSGMYAVPFSRQTVIRLAVAILLPVAPLLLTVIPFDQLLDGLLKTLL